MKLCKTFLPIAAFAMLTACGGGEPDDANDDVATDFAARINGSGSQPSAAATVAPTMAPPHENAAPGPFTAGTATDPQSATCGANVMGPYIGQVADDSTRRAVMDAAGAGRNVRFVAYGSDYIRPDPTNPRLNIMLDRTGTIRDARCG
ncbi:MAG: hypothetical protein WA936_07150 [Erythrobacter sp.]